MKKLIYFVLIAFCFSSCSKIVYTTTPKDEAKANKGWPSHRSWDMVSKILASCNSINANNEIISLLIEGAVGPGAAIEFQTFMSKVDLPDPEELLDNPNSVKFPKGMDKQFIILNSLGNRMFPK